MIWKTISLLFLVSSLHADKIPATIIGAIREAHALMLQKQHEQALDKASAIFNILQKADYSEDPAYRDILVEISKIQQDGGAPDKGLVTAQKVIEVSRKLESDHGLGRGYIVKARCLILLGKLTEANLAIEQGYHFLGKLEDPRYKGKNLIPRCYMFADLGSSFFSKGHLLDAEIAYRSAVKDANSLVHRWSDGTFRDEGAIAAAHRAYRVAASFYVAQGDYLKAIPLNELSINLTSHVSARTLRSSTKRLEENYINLARCYLGLGAYAEAKKMALKAVQTATRSRLPHLQVVALSVFASSLAAEGSYDQAFEQTSRAIALDLRLRKSNSKNAGLVNNLGFIELKRTNYDQAKTFFEEAIALLEKRKDKKVSSVAKIYSSLAMVYYLQGKPDEGAKYLSRGLELYQLELAELALFGTDIQKLAFLNRFRGETNAILSVCFGNHSKHEATLNVALHTVFLRKSLVTQLEKKTQDALKSALKDHKQLSKNDGEIRSRLGILMPSIGILQRDAAGIFARDWQLQLEQNTLQAFQIKKPRKGKLPTISPSLISKRLQKDEILIEYVVYRPFDVTLSKIDEKKTPHKLGALILSKTGKIEAVDLGGYEVIASLCNNYRAALKQAENISFARYAFLLREKLISPLDKHISSYRTLRIATDGALHTIPFEALIDKKGEYLCKNFDCIYTASGSLIPADSTSPKITSINLVGNPIYTANKSRKNDRDAISTYGPFLSQMLVQISRSSGPISFNQLPGTLVEVKTISKKFKTAKLTTGLQATEGYVKELQNPSILHLATHGFYLSDEMFENQTRKQKKVSLGKFATPGTEADPEALQVIGAEGINHPLLNCALTFTGSNNLYDGKDDGILTGIEIAALDLRDTQMVVLSACETGLGKVTEGEGVFGLRQAFHIAGAKSTVMSLWHVADDATASLMEMFYQELKNGKTKSQAMRTAGAKIRSSPQWAHPSFWAPFIVSGDNSPLKFN